VPGVGHQGQPRARNGRGHPPVDAHELFVQRPADQQRWPVQPVQMIPERRLHPCAHAAQTAGQPGGVIAQALRAQVGPRRRRQPYLAGEQRQPLPERHKRREPLRLQPRRQHLILSHTAAALFRRGQAG